MLIYNKIGRISNEVSGNRQYILKASVSNFLFFIYFFNLFQPIILNSGLDLEIKDVCGDSKTNDSRYSENFSEIISHLIKGI